MALAEIADQRQEDTMDIRMYETGAGYLMLVLNRPLHNVKEATRTLVKELNNELKRLGGQQHERFVHYPPLCPNFIGDLIRRYAIPNAGHLTVWFNIGAKKVRDDQLGMIFQALDFALPVSEEVKLFITVEASGETFAIDFSDGIITLT